MLDLERLTSVLGVKKKKIEVVSRERKELVEEVVYGEHLLRLSYGTPFGLKLMTKLWTYRWLSFLSGLYFSSPMSRGKINPFVEALQIDSSESEKDHGEYGSFNEFFSRKLKPGLRPVCQEPGALTSPGDGRLLVFPQIDEDSLSYVKWAPIRLIDLFNSDQALVERYRGGACAVLRLAPADYHRFHFPVAGKAAESSTVPGLLHSVSPHALEEKIPVFALNKRTICTVETEELGSVLLLEVGALGVGSIVQTYTPGSLVFRGEEKGYFKYGGSTCILFIQAGKISFDEDLLENSQLGLETIVKMGEKIGSKLVD